MTMPPDKAQVLRMLIKLCGTKNSIEWACSTDACSCLRPSRSPATASSWPSMSRDYYKLSWPFFDQVRVTHKDGLLCVDPTLKHLHALLTDQANHSAFDFVFVDADSQTDDSSPNPL
ncbi:caffeoyl-CoA O-methyltransferase 1-like [Miscanthus floridulus]|uniref:caffeoyl-CoA O-methyltransferase 1-like n=1 Tax=Miscanthus floridulus TaxID=154761 RepID=UPI0034578BD3